MSIQWIPEQEAAAKLGRKPRTLRMYAKSGKWPVNYTSLNGRRIMYSERDIEKLLDSNSSSLKPRPGRESSS